ncbi:MAG: periplasmic component of the Tol biopolymer transport system like protein [Acidobacteria bacterium]|nr:periplasmic component of the Tol biopolymer transport system like protein [Acidobacteriota bacterium]
MRTWISCLVLCLSLSFAAADPAAPLLLQQPALSATQIVFVFAGDLWRVPRAGGEAHRLTAGPGLESNPAFSPNGSTIAFTGEYDGNVDVFTVPAAGGIPKRLTWHPAADTVLGWTPDGKRVLFSSARESYASFRELYTVDLNGGFPEKLALPMGAEAAYSQDGTQLAYVPLGRAFAVWKRYRGGRATPIWLAKLSDSSIEKLPRTDSNDFNPMWVGTRIYFLSDRSGAVTLFSYEVRSKQVKEEMKNTGLDVKSASAGPGAIVYEQFGSLNLFDLKSGKSNSVPVTLSGDLAEVRDHTVTVNLRLRSAHPSPNASRAVFEARGEILTVPAEKGDPRILTNTPGVMERDPAWSPDGKTIAYFSDESGEYALHLAPQTGTGEVVKIPLEPGFYRGPQWSPDSKKISFVDSHMRIWYIDVETRKLTQVDTERYYNLGGAFVPTWSPDSRWLTYAKRLKNYMYAVHVYSLAEGKAYQVTDGMSDARFPVFDKDGKYLYFAASTDSGPSLQPDVGSYARPATNSLYLVVLSKSEPSPFAPESDEEKPAEEPKPAAPKPDVSKPPAARTPEVKIDMDNIGQRVLSIPMPARRYVALQTGKAGVLFAVETPSPVPGAPGGQVVHRFDLKARRADTILSGVSYFEVARNGEKLLMRQGTSWFIRNVPPAPPAGAAPSAGPPAGGTGGQLQTANMEVKVSPTAEWKQMYHEAWRVERDFFYDPGFHGLDLKAAEKLYEPYLGGIGSRADLNYLFAEMLGNMVVGHLGVGGGDQPEVRRVQTGLLGCDFRIENGRYRFERVYNGENWNPEMRAPLTQPGVNVAAGEYLLAVNGRNLGAADNVFSFFEGTSGKQTTIRVGPDPSGTGARDVVVVPTGSDSRLRNLAWIEDNRRKVDQLTNGRVAYIYLPDTSSGGYTNFNRYFYAQTRKEAAIVDERFNAGGQLATDVIESLSRKLLSSVATRDGDDEIQPQGLIAGPKVMLINETAGSGGDAMPWYFRRAGVGKLIGKRTWGGLVGRAGAPDLMDGGVVTAPSSAVWDPAESKWIAENVGITPDIEVELDPQLVRHGHDPQLEKAVEVVLAELAKSPAKPLQRPPFPKYQTLPPPVKK